MQRNPCDNLPINEYLTSIATRDLEGRYIRPQNHVQARIAEEIRQRTGCSHATLSTGAKELQSLPPVSAEPGKFVGETLNVIETICTALEQERATKFEMRFANPDQDPHWWGDQILVVVRYLT